MKHAVIIIIVIASVWLGMPAPIRACSVGPGYLMPSNFELVRDAEAIVEAKATGFVREEEYAVQVVFDVLKVLKGSVEEKTLTTKGNDRWLGASAPSDFSLARPGAFRGSCIAYDYKLHSHFILFLTKQGRSWSVSGPPFTRVNEEVSSDEAPWSKAVGHYIRISGLGTVDLQKAALRKLAEEGGNIDGLVQDIDRHFHSPHGSKTFADLKELLDKASDDAARSRVLWAFGNGKHAEATDLMRELIKSGKWTRFVEPVANFVETLRDGESVVPILNALKPENKTALPSGRWELLWAVSKAGNASHAAGMLELLKSAKGEEVLPLMDYFARHPDPKAIAELSRRINKEYGNHDNVVMGMTFGVAAMGDRDVLCWALEERKKPGDRQWISHHVLAISPLPEADQAAQEILKGSDAEAMAHLLQGYGESRSPHRIQRLLEGFELRKTHPQLDQWVRYSLRRLAREGDRDAEEALKKLPAPPAEK